MFSYMYISFIYLALFTGFSILVSSNFFHFIVSVSVHEYFHDWHVIILWNIFQISCIIYRVFNIDIIKFLSYHCFCFCMQVIWWLACGYFVKYLSYFWHYLQGFQYWYLQISLISLFVFLYASNLMIDMWLFCKISFRFLAFFCKVFQY